MAYEKRLIEGNFPCQQVGAETKRERGASSALPPLYYLHVWWARRPLTPSRAAVLGSILPADTDPDEFLTELGIVKKQVAVGNQRWTLIGKNLDLIKLEDDREYIPFSDKFVAALKKEQKRRLNITSKLETLCQADESMRSNALLLRWMHENEPIEYESSILSMDHKFDVITVPADPAHINARIDFAASSFVNETLGGKIKIDPEDLYAYGRAYETPITGGKYSNIIVLDSCSGGGSIPFEAARLGCTVIANDLNPVATAIEMATLEYPARFGMALYDDIDKYGEKLVQMVAQRTSDFYYFAPPIGSNKEELFRQCKNDIRLFDKFDVPECDQQGYLYCHYVTCPSCGERVPLLNSFALQTIKDQWMVIPHVEGEKGHKKVRLIPNRIYNGKGPRGEDPENGTISRGIGRCLFCGQAIESEEIKRQARGESPHGTWSDELYCVVGVREQPKLDKMGNIQTYASGPDKGKIKTEKVTFFREPVEEDMAALNKAKEALDENWDRWDELGLIPTERIPEGHKTLELHNVGIDRWCDMFTPRQLLGLLTAEETLLNMIPEITEDLGKEKATAVIHYLQYIIDKCINFSSRQSRWQTSRGRLVGSFSRHDFSLKWMFGEIILTGDNSGIRWGLEQILRAYKEICDLMGENRNTNIKVLNGSAASLAITDRSVDVICIDPPYYNNVQYAELSDYFYVWQKRIFKDLYPDIFSRRLTNKNDEAVANPVRDGGTKQANENYERLMSDIFAECKRVLKNEGIMTMMFTHKTQAAWETLTKALIENGWIITATFPVESEFANALNQKDLAAAASSIFIACRKRGSENTEPAVWSGFGGNGVLPMLRKAVEDSLHDYEPLHLNAVDEMVASYGSALRVLSENWPVMDGEELVSPLRAMKEAGTVVAQHQMVKLTGGRLSVDDVAPEAGVALTLFGIYGMAWFPYDDALSLSKSLNIRLENKAAGYRDEGRMIGINDEKRGRNKDIDEETGYFAPLIKKGSKLRLVFPEERISRRLQEPQNEWDIMQGVIMAYREGDIPVARAYLQKHAEGHEDKITGILQVWADGCGSDDLKKETRRILYGLK